MQTWTIYENMNKGNKESTATSVTNINLKVDRLTGEKYGSSTAQNTVNVNLIIRKSKVFLINLLLGKSGKMRWINAETVNHSYINDSILSKYCLYPVQDNQGSEKAGHQPFHAMIYTKREAW